MSRADDIRNELAATLAERDRARAELRAIEAEARHLTANLHRETVRELVGKQVRWRYPLDSAEREWRAEMVSVRRTKCTVRDADGEWDVAIDEIISADDTAGGTVAWPALWGPG